MAKLLNGINGPIQGTVGTVIGSSWKGIPYIKSRPRKRKTKVRRAEAANRSKFAAAHRWLKPLLKFVRDGFRGYSQKVEGFNAAKSWVLLHAFEGDGAGRQINPALVQVSYGDLPMSANIAVEKTAAGQLLFTWDTTTPEDAHPKDQLMTLAYDSKNGKAYFNTVGQFRGVGSDTLNTDPTRGKTYHIYCAFVAADRSRQSNSVYLGAITM